jgi:hypothetical protein
LSERQLELDYAQRRAAVERVRRARERRRDGLRVIPFEVRDEEIEGLVHIGLLVSHPKHPRRGAGLAPGLIIASARWTTDCAASSVIPRISG